MRKVIYVVGNKTTTSYADARNAQPHGQLKVTFENIPAGAPVNSKLREKRIAYFAQRAREKRALN